MFEVMSAHARNAIIKVIGVGGGGGNAVDHMVAANVQGVDFIAANTDVQALKRIRVETTLQLGAQITKGMGAGADPQIGRNAALADRDRIRDLLAGADMVFITAGMGGGTGTGATPVVAQIAKELGVLTVALVTTPFPFEGTKRRRIAEAGIDELSQHVDSLIILPNEKLVSVLGRAISLLTAFAAIDDVLLHATQGIAEMITRPGLINVDFADVRMVMSHRGIAMMGTGEASGPDRARGAADAAFHCPLLDRVDLTGAKGILVNVAAGLSLTIGELHAIGERIRDVTDPDATVVLGTLIDPGLEDRLRVTVVATGLPDPRAMPKQPASPKVARGPAAAQGDQGRRSDAVDVGRPPSAETPPGRAEPRRLGALEPSSATFQKSQLDYLDVPAFLRRQGDSSPKRTGVLDQPKPPEE